MGIWDYISSTANSVNQYAVTPARNLCWGSCSYCGAAATKIWNSLPNVSQQLQDEDARSNMGQFATNCAKNAAFFACREGLKTVPGGGKIVEIVSRSIPKNHKTEKHGKGELRTLKDGLENHGKEIQELHNLVEKMEKEISILKQVINESERHELQGERDWESTIREANKNQSQVIRGLMGKSLHSNVNKQPMNLIQEMMMRGFISPYSKFDDLHMPKKCPDTAADSPI